jgi:hypothetical protein
LRQTIKYRASPNKSYRFKAIPIFVLPMRIFSTITRLLTFRLSREEILAFNNRHLFAGLIGTWLVGMGRYWDDPGAKLLQHLGLGSVIYVFCLTLFVWLILKPYFIAHWNYRSVLTFICLTSFPAILYAIPVERFFTLQVATRMNVWFLAIVALWRLSLLFYFLRVFTKLHWGYIISIALLPVCVIVTALSILNLERAVFNIMGGLHDTDENANTGAYLVLLAITFFSQIALLPLLLAYAVGISKRLPFRHTKGD